MSNIYIHEPATFGKILLNTTVGDIDIELWSKEAPKTCRNFVQLCLEGYYNGTIFHRVVKGFIVQGGDPEGTGLGGESIYGEPFKDEFHSRLRFVRRGLVAMANSGKDDNGSQFFFTFAPCQELQNKHTIFAKVAGNTLYNMLKLEESLVDQDDRPVYPHKILSCKVISNPFDDIVPRVSQMAEEIMKDEPREKVKKNYSLLSFGEEAEEEEAETDAIVKVYRGKSKSSHDLTKDPKLSSVSVLPLYKESKSESSESHELESIRKKFKKDVGDKLPIPESKPLNVGESSKNSEKVVDDDNRENIRREIKELKRELRKKMLPEKIAEEEEEKKETDKEDKGNPLLAQFHQEIIEYREKTSTVVNSVVDRQKETLNLLAKFQSKIRQAKEKRFEGDEDIHVDSDIDKNNYNDDDDDDDDTWLCHNLYFEEPELLVAKDANMPSVDRFHIHDPRNAMNVRKRQAGKGKKEKVVDNIDKKFNV